MAKITLRFQDRIESLRKEAKAVEQIQKMLDAHSQTTQNTRAKNSYVNSLLTKGIHESTIGVDGKD